MSRPDAATSPAADDPSLPPSGLGRAGASGALWQGLAYVSGKLVVAVATVVLARLLTPHEFGLVALATVFITFADVVSDAGVAQALIYLEPTPAVRRAVLLAALVSGIALAAAGVLGAPAIAGYFGEARVAPLVRLLSVSLLLTAISAVPECLLRRDLRFRQVAIGSAIRALVVGAVSVTLAVSGAGAWALIWGSVSGAFAYLVVLTVMLPSRADLKPGRVSRRDLRTVLGYGLPVAAGMLLAKAVADVDYIVVGRTLGSEALGYYTMAFRLPELAIINIFFVLSSVTFPLYSRARHDPLRLRRGYLSSVRLQSLYGLTAGAGLTVLAPVLVPVVLGHQWVPATTTLALLGVYAAVRSLGAGANDVYKAVGRPMLAVWVSLIRFGLLVPTLVVAARGGIEAVAWAQVAAASAFVLLTQGVALRVVGARWHDLVRAMTPGVVAAAAVVVAVGATRVLLPVDDELLLACGVAAGGVAAVVATRFTAPHLITRVRLMLVPRRAT